MKNEHKEILNRLIDIFDDYEELNAKRKTQENVVPYCDYNKNLFHRICDMTKSDIFSSIFYEWYLENYKTYDGLVAAAKEGKDGFLREKYVKLIKLSEIKLTDIVYIFERELREYFKDQQEEENEND